MGRGKYEQRNAKRRWIKKKNCEHLKKSNLQNGLVRLRNSEHSSHLATFLYLYLDTHKAEITQKFCCRTFSKKFTSPSKLVPTSSRGYYSLTSGSIDIAVNTFAASYLNTQKLNNSCLKSPASTLVDLTFQSRALRSFSLNQLRNLSL